MDDYTENEVVRFYNACACAESNHLRTLALAGRVSQSDQKDWKSFVKGLDDVVSPITKREKPQADLSSDAGLGDFFSKVFVLTNHEKIQGAADKAHYAEKPIPRTLDDVIVEGPAPFPFFTGQTGLPQGPQPIPPKD